VAPQAGFASTVRLPRDYYVRVHGNDYSVDPAVIGQMVLVRADLGAVTVTCRERRVASHDRCWASGLTLTDPAHVAAAARLRQEFSTPPPPSPPDGLTRDLRDYDTAFGIEAGSDGQVA